MQGYLVVFGIFFWFAGILFSYIYITDLDEPFIKRLIDSIRLDISRSAGWEASSSRLKLIGIYWVLLGVVINKIGVAWFDEYPGDLLPMAIAIIPPVVVSAILARNKMAGFTCFDESAQRWLIAVIDEGNLKPVIKQLKKSYDTLLLKNPKAKGNTDLCIAVSLKNWQRLVHGRRIEEYSMIGRTLSWVDDTNNWVPYSIDGAQVQICWRLNKMRDKTQLNDENYLQIVKTKLKYDLHLAQEYAEATYFVIHAKDNLDKIRDEIKAREREMVVKENDASNSDVIFDDELERAYINGLKEKLNYVQEELKKEGSYTEQLTGTLYLYIAYYDALVEAVQFILEADFDMDLITKKIAETEKLIAKPPAALKKEKYLEAIPGAYNNYYLKTLSETALLIDGRMS